MNNNIRKIKMHNIQTFFSIATLIYVNIFSKESLSNRITNIYMKSKNMLTYQIQVDLEEIPIEDHMSINGFDR